MAGKRRGRGEGTIYQRNDGYWLGQIDLGMVEGRRKRVSVSGKTRKDVQEKMKALLRDRLAGEPRLLTIAQAAARLGVHQNTLRGWADKGLVPMVRLPSGYRRFRPAEVERLRAKMGLGARQG